MLSMRFGLGATALSIILSPAGALAQSAKPGSAHVQCDGLPNNMSDGESAARLLGAVTLLGLFAPPPESADASKRKFGADGVAVCSSLIDGDRRETNARRRIGLILGRAIHNIEAKNYQAAIADAGLGRREAQAAGLTADPYFVRSRYRAFDFLESAALVRMGRLEEASAVALRSAEANEYSLWGLFLTPTYRDLIAAPSEGEDKYNQWMSRLMPYAASLRADRLDLGRRFVDSARLRDRLVEFDAEHTPETQESSLIAKAALAYALAGNLDLAAERATAARANSQKRKADGKPEKDASEFVELLDLYNIVATAHGGDLKTARRLFSARSEWPSAPLGAVLEVSRRLREGAAPDELIGGLAKDSDTIWKERSATARAALLAKDSDNKSLFYLIPPQLQARSYEAVSKNVWRTDKSRLLLDLKKDKNKSRMELLFMPLIPPSVALDAYVLHAALLAQSRGHKGFVFVPIVDEKLVAASFRTGNPGDKGFPPELFVDAASAIAKLRQIIPSPAELQARRNK